MKLKNYLPICLFWIFTGCQKDDICPPGTETTPMLIIEFYDNEDPTTLKVVEDLVVFASGKEDTLIRFNTTNSVEIPLKTDENSTEYHFISNAGTENENEDVVRFSYTPVPVYLNRACGFKIEYSNLTLTIDGKADEEWIKSEVVVHQNIENETEAHIYFTH
ncbi:MAG TPA: DUF6452 family protein [Salinimicrobium sp.]|nr:DUF6452 family protein [Salinimicrobium sp.]